MARLLLVDPRERFRGTLPPALERRKHFVQVVTTGREAVYHLQQANPRYDVVIIDLSANEQSDWETLDSIRRVTIADCSRPLVLCVSDRQLGPGVKLDVERKGGRLVVLHERQVL